MDINLADVQAKISALPIDIIFMMSMALPHISLSGHVTCPRGRVASSLLKGSHYCCRL